EEHGVIAAQRGAEQAHGVGGVGGVGYLPAGQVGEDRFAADRVPGVAAHELVANGYAQHDRPAEASVGAPSDAARVGNLLVGGVGILAELDLGHGAQAVHRQAGGASYDALLAKAGVEAAGLAEAGLQAVGQAVYAAERA